MRILLLALLSVLTAGISTSLAGDIKQTADEIAVAYAARVVGDNNRVRLVMDFDRRIKFKTMYLENPDRLVLDLEETIFGLDGSSDERIRGLVTDFRAGAIAPGRSRVVLLTSVPTRVEKYSIKPQQKDGRHRLTMDIIKTDRETYRDAIFLQTGALGESGNVAYKGDRIRRDRKGRAKQFTIVIDPGHGGIDGGAEGSGRTIEKSITLGFAVALKRVLEKTRNIRVLMTREHDVFVSLAERVSFARRNKADLMLSIHADSLRQRQIRGATIYTLSEVGSDEFSRTMAKNENRADIFAGLALPKEDTAVADILLDLARRETGVFSVQFASTLIDRLSGRISLIKNPHRAANFQVLRAPDIPSVLLELGYLSNADDVKQISSSEWQASTSEFVSQAIVAYQRTHEIRNAFLHLRAK